MRKAKKEERSIPVQIRLSSKEYEMLTLVSRRVGMTRAGYLRRQIYERFEDLERR